MKKYTDSQVRELGHAAWKAKIVLKYCYMALDEGGLFKRAGDDVVKRLQKAIKPFEEILLDKVKKELKKRGI